MLWRRLAAGLGAGLLFTASLPPLGWWPAGILGAAVLWVARGVRWRDRLAVGLAAGLGLYGPGLWWVTDFHAAGWVALVLVEALLFGAGVSLVRGHGLLALPAALVLVEAVRGRWPFGGLPLAGLELGQVDGPLLPVARLGGHLAVVAAVGIAGVGLAALVRGRLAGLAALGLVVLAAVAGLVAPDGSEGGTVRVAAVQGGGPRGLRAVGRDQRPVFDAQVAATGRVGPDVQLIVWPEDVVNVPGYLAGSAEEAELERLARERGVTLVAGVVEDDADADRFRNAAVVWGPDGRQIDRFDKVHRVPFGEYVPFRSLVDSVADVSEVPRDARAGTGPGLIDTPLGRLGVLISYEVFFAERGRTAVRSGARLLLVPTNASSYRTSHVPAQELATAQVRAVEAGRDVVQAAPTGYSAVVDARGRVRARGPLGDAAVIERTVTLRRGQTVAVRVGDWPVVLAATAVLAAGSLRRGRKVELNRLK